MCKQMKDSQGNGFIDRQPRRASTFLDALYNTGGWLQDDRLSVWDQQGRMHIDGVPSEWTPASRHEALQSGLSNDVRRRNMVISYRQQSFNGWVRTLSPWVAPFEDGLSSKSFLLLEMTRYIREYIGALANIVKFQIYFRNILVAESFENVFLKLMISLPIE